MICSFPRPPGHLTYLLFNPYVITRIRSVPDSAIQTSPLRPSICRTSALGRSLGKLSKLSVSGSKRTTALALQSETHTLPHSHRPHLFHIAATFSSLANSPPSACA